MYVSFSLENVSAYLSAIIKVLRVRVKLDWFALVEHLELLV